MATPRVFLSWNTHPASHASPSRRRVGCDKKLNLAATHEQRIEDEYAKISTEREARERVIDSLHQEATIWMDRFALTLNGSQELPCLLAKAKATADTYSAPEEIHGLLGYCQHMIDLMAHIIRNR